MVHRILIILTWPEELSVESTKAMIQYMPAPQTLIEIDRIPVFQ